MPRDPRRSSSENHGHARGRGSGVPRARSGELLLMVVVAWVADLWWSAAATLLVVGVDLVLDACPSAPSLLRRFLCRTGLGSLHLLVTDAALRGCLVKLSKVISSLIS